MGRPAGKVLTDPEERWRDCGRGSGRERWGETGVED